MKPEAIPPWRPPRPWEQKLRRCRAQRCETGRRSAPSVWPPSCQPFVARERPCVAREQTSASTRSTRVPACCVAGQSLGRGSPRASLYCPGAGALATAAAELHAGGTDGQCCPQAGPTRRAPRSRGPRRARTRAAAFEAAAAERRESLCQKGQPERSGGVHNTKRGGAGSAP